MPELAVEGFLSNSKLGGAWVAKFLDGSSEFLNRSGKLPLRQNWQIERVFNTQGTNSAYPLPLGAIL